jgi:hypothetical protein
VAGNEIARPLAYQRRPALDRDCATLTARYRIDKLKAGDVSLLIALLGKIGFSPIERGTLKSLRG